MWRKPSCSIRSWASAIVASGGSVIGIVAHPTGDGVTRRVVLGRQRADDVAFGEDPVQGAARQDQRRTDVMDAHELGGLRDGRVRLDRHEGGAHHISEHVHGPRPA